MCRESKRPSGEDVEIWEDKSGTTRADDELRYKWGNPPRPTEKPRGDKSPRTKDEQPGPESQDDE